MFQSIVQERGPVFFPGFNAERHYMVPFRQEQGLPDHLAHWQPTVDAMLVGITSEKHREGNNDERDSFEDS